MIINVLRPFGKKHWVKISLHGPLKQKATKTTPKHLAWLFLEIGIFSR